MAHTLFPMLKDRCNFPRWLYGSSQPRLEFRTFSPGEPEDDLGEIFVYFFVSRPAVDFIGVELRYRLQVKVSFPNKDSSSNYIFHGT